MLLKYQNHQRFGYIVFNCWSNVKSGFVRKNYCVTVMISVDIIIQDLSQTLTKLQVSASNFSFPNLLKIASMPNFKVLRISRYLPTIEKEKLIKMLPHLSDTFESHCVRPTNVTGFCRPCDNLWIAYPYQSCGHWQNGFWEIEAKLRFY